MSDHQENTNDAPFSLIKYEAEIQISDNIDEYEKAKNNQKVLDAKPSPEDVLNNMISPRDWENQQEKHFMQYVSHQKTQREDVTKLRQALEEALEHRQARVEGLCPIREEFFSQAFDQIVRQVTITSPERGLLLMRVRDQHIMTLAAYQTLYQSSVTFGMRKQIESEEGMDQLNQYFQTVRTQKNTLQNQKIELLLKKESLEKKIKERKQEESQQKHYELSLIDEQAQNLSKFLNNLKENKTQ